MLAWGTCLCQHLFLRMEIFFPAPYRPRSHTHLSALGWLPQIAITSSSCLKVLPSLSPTSSMPSSNRIPQCSFLKDPEKAEGKLKSNLTFHKFRGKTKQNKTKISKQNTKQTKIKQNKKRFHGILH